MTGGFLSKLFFHTNDIQPAVKRYFYPERYAPDPGDIPAIRMLAREAALERWGVLDDYLKRHGLHHLGERYSLLDPHMAVWAAYGLDASLRSAGALAGRLRVGWGPDLTSKP